MADQELKVVISSDTADAFKGITQVNTVTKDLGKTSVNTANQLTNSFNKISAASRGVANAQKQLSNTAVNASGSLTALNRVIQDAPFGLIAIQNNIPELFQQFGNLIKQTGSTSAAFKAFGASLLGAGGATFAVSTLTSIFTALIQKYGDFNTALKAISGSLTEAQKLQLEYNKAVADTAGSVGGEIAKITAYLNVAANENISRSQRLAALKELKKEYPGHLKNITLENAGSEEAARAIDKLTESLIRKAKVQAAQDLISKETTKILQAQSKSVIQQSSYWGVFADAVAGATTGIPRFTAQISSGIKQQASAIQDANNNISSYQKLLNDLIKQDALEGAIGLDDKKTEKKVKTISDVIKELNKDLLGLDAAFAAAGGSLSDLSEDKIKAITGALKELSSFGVLPGSDLFDSLQKQIAVLQTTLTRTPVVLKVPISIETIQPASNANTIRAVLEGVKQDFTNVNAVIVDQGKAMAGLFASVGEGLSTAIANVLTGKATLVQALGSLLGIMGDFITQFGKTLIEAATLRIIAEKTLLANPYAALAAGIGAVIIGQTLKNFTPSFATGGTVFGPTLAMIGDNPGREEHIIPSEVLDKLGGGNWGDFVLTGTLRGTDIVIAAKRASNNQLRING